MSFRPQRKRSGGIYHVGERNNTRKNLLLGKIPRLTSFARNDISGGGSVLSPRVLFDTLHGDESSPLHYVVPFNHTGYIRNVAGGRLPPLRTHRLVIPFIRTGCIRGVPGTAHRPFPTVSLTRPFFQPSSFKNVRFLTRRDKRGHTTNRRIVNCPLSMPIKS